MVNSQNIDAGFRQGNQANLPTIIESLQKFKEKMSPILLIQQNTQAHGGIVHDCLRKMGLRL